MSLFPAYSVADHYSFQIFIYGLTRLLIGQTGRALTETQIHHELEESGTVSVDGHDLPGSFRQKINYNVDPQQGERQMYTLIDRAKTCHQNVRYRCRFESPGLIHTAKYTI